MVFYIYFRVEVFWGGGWREIEKLFMKSHVSNCAYVGLSHAGIKYDTVNTLHLGVSSFANIAHEETSCKTKDGNKQVVISVLLIKFIKIIIDICTNVLMADCMLVIVHIYCTYTRAALSCCIVTFRVMFG